MRLSSYPINTLRDVPADAEVVSHQLMLRAGLIRRLAAGLYTWLPIGLRVLRKVENIIREEMNRAGAHELLMPTVQPAELWQESGRWDQFGPELLRFQDRNERPFCYGPTHEEVITDIARREHFVGRAERPEAERGVCCERGSAGRLRGLLDDLVGACSGESEPKRRNSGSRPSSATACINSRLARGPGRPDSFSR